MNNAEGALAWPAMAYRLHGNRTQGQRSMQLVLEMIDTYQALARRPSPNPNPVIDALTPSLTLTLTLSLSLSLTQVQRGDSAV